MAYLLNIYNSSGVLQQSFSKTEKGGRTCSINSNGEISVPSLGTYAPSTTIDGYSTSAGGSLTYANGSSFSWLLNLSIYEHVSAPTPTHPGACYVKGSLTNHVREYYKEGNSHR